MDKTTSSSQKSTNLSQLRKHYYLDSYVVISPQPVRRPPQARTGLYPGDGELEQLLASSPLHTAKAKGSKAGEIKTVPHPRPLMAPGSNDALGHHEIVIESTDSNVMFSDLNTAHLESILAVYADRIRALRPDYDHITIFKNEGPLAGAEYSIPYSEIVATNFVPASKRHEQASLTSYQENHETSALCDVIRWELTQAQRVVAHTRYATTITPYASDFPLEIWIIPNQQHHSIETLSKEEIHAVADHLKGITHALSANDIDFNYYFTDGLPGESNHCFIKVVPALHQPNGFDAAMKTHRNSVTPEYARKWYQKYIKINEGI